MEGTQKIVYILLLLLFPISAFAHSGRTNSAGCHNNHKTGGYHCHGGGGGSGGTSSGSSYDYNKLKNPVVVPIQEQPKRDPDTGRLTDEEVKRLRKKYGLDNNDTANHKARMDRLNKIAEEARGAGENDTSENEDSGILWTLGVVALAYYLFFKNIIFSKTKK